MGYVSYYGWYTMNIIGTYETYGDTIDHLQATAKKRKHYFPWLQPLQSLGVFFGYFFWQSYGNMMGEYLVNDDNHSWLMIWGLSNYGCLMLRPPS